MNSMKYKTQRAGAAKALTKTLSPLVTPFFLLTAAALIVISSPGCRFGNNKEEPKPTPNPDTVTGFYDMTPQSVKFCVKKDEKVPESCIQPSLTKIPPGLLAILTDPIALILVSLDNGDAALKNPDTDGYLFTKVAKSGSTFGPTLSYSPTYPSQPLWEVDDPCTLSMNRLESGSYSKYDAPVAGTKGRSIVGRVTYHVKREWKFSGKCEDSLSVMAACFLSSEYCGGKNSQEDNELQAMVQDFFSPFVDSGAFSAVDIPDLRMMRYEIQY